jgi:hypothetical protein
MVPNTTTTHMILLSSRLSNTKVYIKLFNMTCLNFDEQGGANLQSRLLMGYVGPLASGLHHSSHGQEVTSLIPLLLRPQWQQTDEISDTLLL